VSLDIAKPLSQPSVIHISDHKQVDVALWSNTRPSRMRAVHRRCDHVRLLRQRRLKLGVDPNRSLEQLPQRFVERRVRRRSVELRSADGFAHDDACVPRAHQLAMHRRCRRFQGLNELRGGDRAAPFEDLRQDP
jgi:hypothetical protein